jgi:hypothetical protein
MRNSGTKDEFSAWLVQREIYKFSMRQEKIIKDKIMKYGATAHNRTVCVPPPFGGSRVP